MAQRIKYVFLKMKIEGKCYRTLGSVAHILLLFCILLINGKKEQENRKQTTKTCAIVKSQTSFLMPQSSSIVCSSSDFLPLPIFLKAPHLPLVREVEDTLEI